VQLWKIAAIMVTVTTQFTPVHAAQTAAAKSTTGNSCLEALGALGTPPDISMKVVDGTTMNSASDLRSLRRKAKDGLPILIKGGDFSGKKFGDDDFSNLCFDGTNFAGTRWSKSRADGIAFINANLTGAIFDRVSLRGVLFRNSILTRMDASGTNMSYGQLDGGWDPGMAGLRLENAQMTGFSFQCGTTSGDGCSFDRKQISLRGANLTAAKLARFSLWDANLVDVILNNTEIALDQIPQYANANVQGPLLVQAAGKQALLSPDAFQAAVAALGATQTPDTECANPATPLSQIFCQTGQADLRAYRDDVDRLYQSIATRPRPDGTSITVVAPSKDQDRYLGSLRKCALKDEEKATTCIWVAMAKRRAALVALLTKSNPLEPDARALFVNIQTPLLQAMARDNRLASLTPLIIGSAPTFLLAYRDDDNALNVKGISQAEGGTRCVYAFAAMPATKSRKKKRAGSTFDLWSAGAEFAIAPIVKGKRKVKKTRNGKRQATEFRPAVIPSEANMIGAGCASSLKSGPLIRVPLSEADFDLLWTENQPVSG
jgi:uncharacterized protein YjbI with pentapeptide repeats